MLDRNGMTGMSRLLFTKQKLLPMYVILFERLKKKCKLWAPTWQKRRAKEAEEPWPFPDDGAGSTEAA